MQNYSNVKSAHVPDNSTLLFVSDPPPLLYELKAQPIRVWLRQLSHWRLRNTEKQLSMWRLCSGDIANQLVLMIHRSKAPLSDMFRPPAAAAVSPDTKAATPSPLKDPSGSSEFQAEMESLLDSSNSSLLMSPEARTMETKTVIVLSQNSEYELLHYLKQRYGPYDDSESLELLRRVKMPIPEGQSPYIDEGPFVSFIYDFSETLEWVHLQRPSEKCLIEVFLAGIQPTVLRQKLKDKDFKSLEALASCFREFFEKNV